MITRLFLTLFLTWLILVVWALIKYPDSSKAPLWVVFPVVGGFWSCIIAAVFALYFFIWSY